MLGLGIFSLTGFSSCDKSSNATREFMENQRQEEFVRKEKNSSNLEGKVGLPNFEKALRESQLQEYHSYIDKDGDTVNVLEYKMSLREWRLLTKNYQLIGKEFRGWPRVYLDKNNFSVHTSKGWPGVYNLITWQFDVGDPYHAQDLIEIEENWKNDLTNSGYSFLLLKFNTSIGEVNIKGFYASQETGDENLFNRAFYITDIQSSEYSGEKALLKLAFNNYEECKEISYPDSVFNNILKELRVSKTTLKILRSLSDE